MMNIDCETTGRRDVRKSGCDERAEKPLRRRFDEVCARTRSEEKTSERRHTTPKILPTSQTFPHQRRQPPPTQSQQQTAVFQYRQNGSSSLQGQGTTPQSLCHDGRKLADHRRRSRTAPLPGSFLLISTSGYRQLGHPVLPHCPRVAQDHPRSGRRPDLQARQVRPPRMVSHEGRNLA